MKTGRQTIKKMKDIIIVILVGFMLIVTGWHKAEQFQDGYARQIEKSLDESGWDAEFLNEFY